MAEVFITHEVKRSGRKEKVAQFDFSDAERFGSLKVADFPEGAFSGQENATKSSGQMRDFLSKFNKGDYLLAVGDPLAIALAAGHLFKRFGTINVLKWDREQKQYYPVEISL